MAKIGKDCGIRFPQTNVFNKIDKIFGNNYELTSAIKLEVWSGGDKFSPEFIEWFKKKNNTNEEPQFKVRTKEAIDNIASNVREYYYSLHSSIYETVNKNIINETTRVLDYTSSIERENGKSHIADIILDEFNRLTNENITLDNNQINHYLDVAKNEWLNVIFNTVLHNTDSEYKSLSEIKKSYNDAEDKNLFIQNLLKDNNDATIKNILAVYNELFDVNENGIPTKAAINYITQVLYNPKLIDVLHEIRKDLEDTNLLMSFDASDEENVDSVEISTIIDEVDESIAKANNHIGVYTTFMSHIGSRIRNYFNSLKKLKSPTIDDYDTSNTYGIPDRMDANQCSSMIYNNADVSNISNFKASIRRIGETIRGFEAFVKLANDLDKNLDFATEMLTVFQKAIFDRFNVVEEDGVSSIKISNQEASPRNVMVFNMLNDIRGNVEDIAYDSNTTKVNSIDGEISQLRVKKDLSNDDKLIQITSIKNKLFNLIRSYFPSIQELALQSYVQFNDNAGLNADKQLNNLNQLCSITKLLVNNSKTLYNSYNNLKLQASAIISRNDERDEKRRNGEWVDLNEYESTNVVWSTPFTTAINKQVQEFVNRLLPYSDIATSLNSRNIYGNNNSSVINVSWITRLEKMLELNQVEADGTIRNPTLEKWGEEISKYPQYKYSTIIFEHRDESGKLLNPGLFSNINGVLRVTPYAQNLIKCMLFDGSSFIDQGNNASYADMTSGTFLPTSYIAYHNTDQLSTDGEFNGKVATYFLGTPADAPKIFAARLPKIDTYDLVEISNFEKERIENDINEIIKSEIPIVNLFQLSSYLHTNNDPEYLLNLIGNAENKISDNDLYDYLKPNHNIILNNRTLIKELDNNRAYGTFVTKSGIVLTLEGDLVKAGKGIALSNAKLVAVLDDKITSVDGDVLPVRNKNKSKIPEEIETYYRNKYKKLLSRQDVTVNGVTYKKQQETINVNSKAFKLLYSQFAQEMLDAANALHHYFEFVPITDKSGKIIPGHFKVKLDDNTKTYGKPVFKENVDPKKGYKHYHLDENGEVLREKDGVYSLNGFVFGSNKFTLVNEEIQEDGSVISTPENYLDKVIDRSNNPSEDSINLLYGGGMAIVCDVDSNNNPTKVIDVVFNEQQEANITRQLSKFILDYRKQAIQEIESREELIHNVSTNNDAITDYAINQLLTFYTFDDLFIGSSKFYKNVQTILKRTKEYQASGVPYGIADISEFGMYSLDDIDSETSYLNSGYITEPVKETYVDAKGKVRTRNKLNENGDVVTKQISIQDLFKGTILEGTTQRKGFRAVTIANSIRTNDVAIKELIEKLKKEGVSEEKAKDILYGKIKLDKNGNPKKNKAGDDYEREGGFTDTKVNDAQSYITVQEWVRRIFARGQGQRYMPLIRKLIDPNYKLTAKDKEEFIQVQKNVYFDIHSNEDYNLRAPRQIKNAEFVLVPQLIEGTQLEQVYELMRDANIDQLNTVETSKAANEEVLTLWDDDGNISSERIEHFAEEADSAAQIYSYNYLYTQQETPQHMNAENKAGIQILKKIIDNIPDNLPETHPLYGLKDEFFGLLNENITESFIKVLNEINVPLNPDGTVKLDDNGNIKFDDEETAKNFYKNFYNKLKEELLRTGLDNNSSKFVDIPDDGILPEMPCYINNYITKFESLVQSIFNNGITRQKLPGFHAPQITNVGWKSMNEDLINLDELTLKKKSIYKRFKQWANKNNRIVKFENNHLTEDSIKSFNDYIKETFPNQQYAKELKYHLDDNGNYTSYIQVILPYSYLGIDKTSSHYKNMTDEDIIKELTSKGLDKLIGYRIPTEGKQSICNMQVVGFIDDSYGSTIIVPDDWVTQTGSDFDVDSVYGIQYETYKTRTGELKKIQYNNSVDFYSYFDYIAKDNDDIKNLLYTSLSRKQDAIWEALPSNVQAQKKQIDAIISAQIKAKNLNGKSAFQYRTEQLYSVFYKLSEDNKGSKISEDFKKLAFINAEINEYLNSNEEIGKNSESKVLKDLIDLNREEIEKLAKEKNLLSYDEFKSNKFKYRHNSRRARNNRILEIFQQILNDPSTLEETLYRSQFEDLVFNRDEIMNKNISIARKNRSPYNVFDQIKFQEEAMSGAKLKAMSVSLDTFCSVCNKVKPELEDGILVIYENDRFNVKELQNSFNIETTTDDGIAIRHTTYGWSKDYRNVVGKFITAYSSQTTAFILDAIKEGSLPNVNEYSFSVFKTLPNLGCDFRAALSFIMSPGVTKIIEANNNNNSVFSITKRNPIHEAIFNIAKQLGINVDKNTPVVAVLNSINAKYGKEFNEIFKVGKDDIKISLDYTDATNIPINVRKVVDRIKEQGEFDSKTPVEKKLLFDLGTILTFNRLKNISDQIGDIARCCNPDKFGAKQTVYATRNVFKTMDDILYDEERQVKYNSEGKIEYVKSRKLKDNNILSVNGKHILESIYPGCTNVNSSNDYINYILSHDDIDESSYPSLYSYLKHSTAISTLIAKNILDTEKEDFVNLIEGLENVFSNNNRLDENTYNVFKKYVLSSLYSKISSIKYKVRTKLVNGKIQLSLERGFNSKGDKEIDDRILEKDEQMRIRGYEQSPSLQYQIVNRDEDGNITSRKNVPFVVKDIYNPTEDELNIFETFSPAQKVKFIQTNFVNSGIFGLLNVSLFNGPNRGRFRGMQTIEFKDENLSSNAIYSEFKQAFYNTNPLIVSAAIDLVKYAVQVEGLNMSAKAINKIIDYDVLIGDFGESGLGFVNELKDLMANIDVTYADKNLRDKLYENFLRSHPDLTQIRTIYLSRKNVEKYHLNNNQYGCYVIEMDNSKENKDDNKKAFNSMLSDAGIKYHLTMSDSYITNSYVRLKSAKDKKTKLYKIKDLGDTIILYPIDNLEANENTDWSSNEQNNKSLHRDAYESIISDYALDKLNTNFTYDYVKEELAKLREERPDIQQYYKRRRIPSEIIPADVFDINDCEPGDTMWNARDKIKEALSSTAEGKHYVITSAFNQYIHAKGKLSGSVQKIKLDDGRIYNVRIYKSTLNNVPINENISNVIKDETILPYIGDMIKSGAKYINNLYTVILEPTKENTSSKAYASQGDENILSVDEDAITSSESVNVLSSVHSKVISFVKNRQESEGDQDSIKLIYKLNSKGIYSAEESIKSGDIPYVTKEIADYANKFSSAIKNMFNNFLPDPDNDGTYLSMLDPFVIEKIKTNRDLRYRFLTACNLAQAFIDLFSPYNELNATSDDLGIKHDINSIIKSLKTINDTIPLKQATRIYYNTVVASMSTNPLIQDDMIDVLDGYWKTYGSMWKFNDIMETGSPLMQITLRDIMSDIETKRKLGKLTKQEFFDSVSRIYKQAAALGETINLSKIVDKDGRTVRDYSPQLIEDFDKLKEERDEAILKSGLGSIDHLKAKLKVDEFIAKHFNQEALPEYYIKKNALVNYMLTYFPAIYSQYESWNYERRNIYTHKDTTGFTDSDSNKLDELNYNMNNLIEEVYYKDNDGTLKKRPHLYEDGRLGYDITEIDVERGIEEELGFHEVDKDTALMYSVEASNALREHINDLRELNDEYFKYDAVFNFEQQLKETLATISRYEDRDPNGIPKHPISELIKIKQYRDATEWLADNAYFKLTTDGTPEAITLYDKLKKAFKVLKCSTNRKVKIANRIAKGDNVGNNGKPIYDTQGIPDARLLSDEDIKRIKDEQEFVYTDLASTQYSDEQLIRNVKPTDKKYKPSFYKNMKADDTDANANIIYNNTVKKINNILSKYINPVDGYVHIENVPDTEEGYNDLLQLTKLYDTLRLIRPTLHNNATNKQQIKEFMEKEVVFEDNLDYYLSQLNQIQNKSERFKELVSGVLYDKEVLFEEGVPTDISYSTYVNSNGETRYRPNRYLFSTVKPKNEENWLLENDETQQAIDLVNKVYEKTNTIYYEIAKAEADAAGKGVEWYYANHVYNPRTKQMEPLDCWVTYKVRNEIAARGILVGTWLPKGKSSERQVRDGKIKVKINGKNKEVNDPQGSKVNPNYKENSSFRNNYIVGSGYDNPITLNNSEKALRDLFTDTLVNISTVAKAKTFFEKGFLPRMGRSGDTTLKTIGKETLKLFGIVGANNKAETEWKESIGFIDDSIPDLPMQSLLKTKQSYDYEGKNKQLQKDKKLLEESTELNETEKAEQIKAIDDKIKENNEKINEIHRAHLNNDWVYVIGEYIEQVSRFNAVQENKQALYHLLTTLNDYKSYNTAKTPVGRLKQDRSRTSKNNPVFEESIDKNLIEQYENFIRRLLFDQWKEDSGMVTITNALQGFTSANYMMMNIKGGVANVTLGETNIIAEAAAKEFFGASDWAFGTSQWDLGVVAFCRRAYHDMIGDEAGYFNKQDAIVDFFDVFDYDERSGVVTDTNLEKYSKKLRDVMFSPQNIGEHFMQNSVLFSMLHCHKIVTMSNGETTYMNENDYIRYKRGEMLLHILNSEQLKEFNAFKESIKKSPNELKDYAWFRKDALSQFIAKHCTKEQKEKISKLRKEKEKQFKDEFRKLQNMYDQIDVKDGKFHFVDGSDLAKLASMPSYDGSKINKAYQLLGQFTERVRKVNNKIHGVYNKDGRAYIESKWFGSLVMQYHKHLPIGILKHYMRRGHWNEFRESVDKGMLQSCLDMHRLNIEGLRAEKGLTDEQVGALEGFIFLMTHCLSYLGNIRLTWNIMPEYDRANIRRRVGNYAGVTAALATTAGLWAIAGGGVDDDTPDSLAFNFFLYEADRLASESFMYNPLGFGSEIKKLFSSPVAAKSIIDDSFKSLKFILDYIFDDEFDPYYHSGRFAGENKLTVYIKRRIPIYSAIYNTVGLQSANHYYKYGENPIGIFNIKKSVLD